MEPIEMLVRGIVVLALLGVIYSVLLVAAVRRGGARWLWIVWACAVILLTAWGVWQVSDFPGGPLLLTIYFMLSLFGLPLAATTLAVRRGIKRKPDRGLLQQALWGFVFFLVGLPIGLIVGAIPDALQLFR